MRGSADIAYVLHRRPWSDSSLLVEIFTPLSGRLVVIAKGARRVKSKFAGLLQPFIPLQLAWSGRGEVKTLIHADYTMCLHNVRGIDKKKGTNFGSCLSGRVALCGLYLNELVMHLLAKEDVHETLFTHYDHVLFNLSTASVLESALRRFELQLLDALGYGLPLVYEADGVSSVLPEKSYYYEIQSGPVPADAHSSGKLMIRGATLLALDSGQLNDSVTLREARNLMRFVLDYYLGGKPNREWNDF